MIDILKAKKEFKKFLESYNNQEQIGFDLKVKHTYQVVENAKYLANKLNLNEEDEALAELIALLHDIGRFEELKVTKEFDNSKFDHASYGVKMLFEDGMIRRFVEDEKYDNIIEKAIGSHSLKELGSNLTERELLHAKIIRDADKLDNYRVKIEEKVETIFPGKMKEKDELENSTISEKVYESVKNNSCVDVNDRKTILDFWVCVLAFTFDLNFKESYELIKQEDYINRLIDRFNYNNPDSFNKMEDIRRILINYVNTKINE